MDSLEQKLQQMLAEVEDQRRERKRSTKKRKPRIQPSTERQPRVQPQPQKTPADRLYASTRWRVRAIELVVENIECQNCGACFESPHRHPMLVRYHPQFGYHEEALYRYTGCVDITGLPRKIRHINHEAPTCHHCFQHDAPPAFTGEQLALPFDPPWLATISEPFRQQVTLPLLKEPTE